MLHQKCLLLLSFAWFTLPVNFGIHIGSTDGINLLKELSDANTICIEHSFKTNQDIDTAGGISQNQFKNFRTITRSGTSQSFTFKSNQIQLERFRSAFHRTNEFTEDGDGVDWFDGDN